jgi:hypothetical protein
MEGLIKVEFKILINNKEVQLGGACAKDAEGLALFSACLFSAKKAVAGL